MIIKGTAKAQLIPKCKLGSIEKDSLIWVEYRDAMPGFDLDVVCYQGIGEYYAGNGEYDTILNCFCGFEETKSYGIDWRAWTDRPTQELMDNTPWDDEQE